MLKGRSILWLYVWIYCQHNSVGDEADGAPVNVLEGAWKGCWKVPSFPLDVASIVQFSGVQQRSLISQLSDPGSWPLTRSWHWPAGPVCDPASRSTFAAAKATGATKSCSDAFPGRHSPATLCQVLRSAASPWEQRFSRSLLKFLFHKEWDEIIYCLKRSLGKEVFMEHWSEVAVAFFLL